LGLAKGHHCGVKNTQSLVTPLSPGYTSYSVLILQTNVVLYCNAGIVLQWTNRQTKANTEEITIPPLRGTLILLLSYSIKMMVVPKFASRSC